MSETLKQKILTRMSLLDIQPKRSLGQNFLVSDNVVNKIIEAADASQFEKVYEIGPGLGTLTDDLKEQSKSFQVVELDQKFAKYWRDQGVDVDEVDALKKDWSFSGGSHLLVSNLPYQISSRIVVDMSLQNPSFNRMVLMFQKEVAQRIVAESSTAQYGLLSVVAQVFWNVRLLLEAGAVDFMPKPNVASRVLVFDRKKEAPNIGDSRAFLQFLKACFANRRKKLLPKLTSFQPKPNLVTTFADLGFDEGVRAEKLSPEDFIKLYSHLKSE